MLLPIVLTLLPRQYNETQTLECSGLYGLCTQYTQSHFVGALLFIPCQIFSHESVDKRHKAIHVTHIGRI